MKIIIGTDGSEFSEDAVKACLDLVSGATELEIKVIAVYESPAPMATEPFIGAQEYYQYVSDEARKLAEDYAQKAEASVKAHSPKAITSTQIITGKPAQQIVESAEEWKADLIVVGSHGRGVWGRALLGSVSDAVLHHAPCSVLVVRKK